MKTSLKIKLFLIIFIFLVACNSTPKETEPIVTKQVDNSTSTATLKPTLAAKLTQTPTLIPTATFTPWPTKEVLLQFGIFGGDGGWAEYAFVGRDTPKLILYTDGQLIVQKEDTNGIWFEETKLTIFQMCAFLAKVENTGFYNLEINNSSSPAYPTDNPIYRFDNTAQFSEGGSNYVIQVNGPKPRQILVYSQHVQYLIPNARRIFNLFNNYFPPSGAKDYRAQYMLLRIEKGFGDSIYSTPAPTPQTWSADLPSLDVLATENVETAASAFFARNPANQITQVLVKDEQVEPIFKSFGNRLTYKIFRSESSVYYVAARPLLPHETLNNFSGFPKEKLFVLPFSCSN